MATVALLACTSVWAAEPLPTQDEIVQALKDQKYPLVLQKLSRVLVLKGEAAKPYDRHELLRIKGEAHIGMKASAPAASAFAEAAKEAPDPTSGAVDAATELLLRRSQGLSYTPKVKDKAKPAGAIPIADPDKRKPAFAALFDDELAAAQPKLRAAHDATTLSPIVDLLPTIRTLRNVELAASEKDEQTRKQVELLSEHAKSLMASAIKQMAAQLETIDKRANEFIRYQESVGDVRTSVRMEIRYRKRGLDNRDASAVRDIMATCQKIVTVSRELSQALGTKKGEMDSVRADAEKSGHKADAIFNADYRRSYASPEDPVKK